MLLLALALTGCKFEADIPPLVIPTAPPPAFQSSVEAEGEVTQLEPGAAGGGLRLLGGFDSSQAMAQCGDELSWGELDTGFCDVPGKDTFYIWTSPDQVYEVGAGDPNLVQFQQAVLARMAATAEFEKEKREMVIEFIALGGEFALTIPLCPTLLGCIADGVAILATGLAIAESGEAFIVQDGLFRTATDNAGFYFCMMQGSTEAQCRETHLGGEPP